VELRGWQFDGHRSKPEPHYAAPGAYTVSLTVTDTSGLSATATAATTVSPPPPVKDWVMAGRQPISNSSVELYAAGAGTASAAVPLLNVPVITDQYGGFSIAGLYTCPSPDTQVYLAATGGNPGLSAGANNAAIALMAALVPAGTFPRRRHRSRSDEISTIVAIWPGYAYQSSLSQVGAADPRNLSNSFIDSANLAGIVSGAPPYPGILIANQDEAIRSLANSLDTCVRSNGDLSAQAPCGQLFGVATPAGGPAPPPIRSWLQLAIALSPKLNVAPIFNLACPARPFQPALTAAPADWTLGLPRSDSGNVQQFAEQQHSIMGDSITNFWALPINNAGISGNMRRRCSPRFATDVLGPWLCPGSSSLPVQTTSGFPGVGTDQAVEQIESMARWPEPPESSQSCASFHR